MDSARSVSIFGGRRRRGGDHELALSLLACYVPVLSIIVQNRASGQDSVFLDCGFSEIRLISEKWGSSLIRRGYRAAIRPSARRPGG
jgi:hypothetical protein